MCRNCLYPRASIISNVIPRTSRLIMLNWFPLHVHKPHLYSQNLLSSNHICLLPWTETPYFTSGASSIATLTLKQQCTFMPTLLQWKLLSLQPSETKYSLQWYDANKSRIGSVNWNLVGVSNLAFIICRYVIVHIWYKKLFKDCTAWTFVLYAGMHTTPWSSQYLSDLLGYPE